VNNILRSPRDLAELLSGRTLPAAPLEALVGPQRAAVLRMLDRPCHAGAIASGLHLTPSAVTYHLKALEAAGLVIRERVGGKVLVHRTGRGTRLLGLYETS
jgi:DNA-binding transcriptional ArsR family regulator